MTVPWAPSIDEVGALLHARTLDNNGSELGTFTADTRPTDVQVTSIIGNACDDVVDSVGQAVPQNLFSNASTLATIGAAMLVELSFWPEQVGAGKSPYAQLKDMYTTRLLQLKQAVAWEGGESPGTEYMHPAGAFGGNPVPIQWWTPW